MGEKRKTKARRTRIVLISGMTPSRGSVISFLYCILKCNYWQGQNTCETK